MDPLGDALKRELKALGPNSAMSETVQAWPAAVGPEGSRDQLEDGEERHRADQHLAVERLPDEAVAHAEHVRKIPAEDADH